MALTIVEAIFMLKQQQDGKLSLILQKIEFHT